VLNAHSWGINATVLVSTEATTRNHAACGQRWCRPRPHATTADGAASPPGSAFKRCAIGGIQGKRRSRGSPACCHARTTATRRHRRVRRADGCTARSRATAAALTGHGRYRGTPGGSRGARPSARLTVRRAKPESATTWAAVLADGAAGRASARLPRPRWCNAFWTWRSLSPIGCATACTSGYGPICCGTVGNWCGTATPLDAG
jgi:hypothetical protein